MNTIPKASLWLLATTLSLSAQVTNNFTVGSALIPDGNPVGVAEQFTVSGVAGAIGDMQVQLDITGGFNGGMYAYLVSPQGQLAVLLNRTGVAAGNPFGYRDAGFNITLDGAATNNIHDYQSQSPTIIGGQVAGTWAADGRNINPQSSGTVFDGTSPMAGMNIYIGVDGGTVNGTWTLFIADLSSGGGSATLQGAVLSIMTVPEPTSLAVSVLGGLLAWAAVRRNR